MFRHPSTRSCRSLMIALCCFACAVMGSAAWLRADDKAPANPAPRVMKLADGSLEIPVPESWIKRAPRFRMIQYEFEIKSKQADVPAARVTVMGAGGSIDANVDRWKGQFAKLDKTDRKEMKSGGCTVYILDLMGTFRDQAGGPFSRAPAKLRPEYRMLGAIVVTPGKGQYFIKAVGPAATLKGQRESLEKALAKLKFQAK